MTDAIDEIDEIDEIDVDPEKTPTVPAMMGSTPANSRPHLKRNPPPISPTPIKITSLRLYPNSLLYSTSSDFSSSEARTTTARRAWRDIPCLAILPDDREVNTSPDTFVCSWRRTGVAAPACDTRKPSATTVQPI